MFSYSRLAKRLPSTINLWNGFIPETWTSVRQWPGQSIKVLTPRRDLPLGSWRGVALQSHPGLLPTGLIGLPLVRRSAWYTVCAYEKKEFPLLPRNRPVVCCWHNYPKRSNGTAFHCNVVGGRHRAMRCRECPWGITQKKEGTRQYRAEEDDGDFDLWVFWCARDDSVN